MDFRKQYLLNCIKSFLMLSEEPKSLVKSSLFDDFIAAKDKDAIILVYVFGKGTCSLTSGFKIFKPEESLPAESQLICILKMLPSGLMTEMNLSECFSVSLLPSDSIKHLVYEI